MVNTDTIRVPLKIYGKIVGTAKIGPYGEITAEIDSSKVGLELKDKFISGWSDSLSLCPENIAPSSNVEFSSEEKY